MVWRRAAVGVFLEGSVARRRTGACESFMSCSLKDFYLRFRNACLNEVTFDDLSFYTLGCTQPQPGHSGECRHEICLDGVKQDVKSMPLISWWK